MTGPDENDTDRGKVLGPDDLARARTFIGAPGLVTVAGAVEWIAGLLDHIDATTGRAGVDRLARIARAARRVYRAYGEHPTAIPTGVHTAIQALGDVLLGNSGDDAPPVEVPWRQAEDAVQTKQVDAVRALHVETDGGMCAACARPGDGGPVAWPCSTIEALNAVPGAFDTATGEWTPHPAPAATETSMPAPDRVAEAVRDRWIQLTDGGWAPSLADARDLVGVATRVLGRGQPTETSTGTTPRLRFAPLPDGRFVAVLDRVGAGNLPDSYQVLTGVDTPWAWALAFAGEIEL
jgi:hypothetical protein